MKKLKSGKVRDVYEVPDDRLVIVTTDRISAFYVILPKPVEGKGKVLNAVSLFWFDCTKDIIPNHVVSSDPKDMPVSFQTGEFFGRTVLVKKLNVLPFEFVVRGYIFGHMWHAYCKDREFCGYKIERDYDLAEKLDTPLFTPSTKAHAGHDQYITEQDVADAIGAELTNELKRVCLKLYDRCNSYANSKGLIIADTKFEFGLDEFGALYLADEICTPDSSRYWSLAEYKTGISPKSYDKQFLRDWLLSNKADGKIQFDNVPDEVLSKTAEIYKNCLQKLMGE